MKNLYRITWTHNDPEDDRKPETKNVVATSFSAAEEICEGDTMKTQHWYLSSIVLVEREISIEGEFEDV